MRKWKAGSRFRRLLAHLSTPLLAALLATLLFPDADTILERLGIFVPAAYFVWLLLGLPVGLLSSRKPRSVWTYLAFAGIIVGIPVLVIAPIRSLADLGLSLSYVAIGVAAGLWYWFCADWKPRRRATLAGPE